MSETDPTIVQGTKTSFRVLQALHELDGAGVTETADHLDIPKSTAHKHLTTLERIGYVTQSSHDYELGVPFIGFGRSVQESNPLFEATRDEVEHLADMTEEIAGLYVEQNGRGFEIYRERGANADEIDGDLPGQLHCTAPGKAILAELTDDRVDEIVDKHGLPSLTDQTIGSHDALKAELRRIHHRGIAFDREEATAGVRGVAVPITGESVRGAVYVIGARQRLTGKWFDENIPGIIVSSVNSIEQTLDE